jgi:hypothetical protein
MLDASLDGEEEKERVIEREREDVEFFFRNLCKKKKKNKKSLISLRAR